MSKTREDRWWDTYNAALAGLIVADKDSLWTYEVSHRSATAYANAAHGPVPVERYPDPPASTEKKLEREGKVAVVYSPDYGAGWSTWNVNHAEDLCMDADIARAVEAGNNAEAARIAESRFPDDICVLGAAALRIAWVPKGCRFVVREYDGSESVEVIGPDYGWIA